MENYAVSNELIERRSISERKPNPYCSVEFTFDDLDVLYQFKVWNTRSGHMCVIVREESDVLPRMSVGDVLGLKYNFKNTVYLSEYLKTAIRFIIKQNNGRYRGHYIVGFEVLRN